MIGYHPYVIAALLLIYPHLTHQILFYRYERFDIFVEHDFRYENPGSPFRKFLTKALGLWIDVVCDKLDEYEKQRLCDQTMPFVIGGDHGGGSFGSFLQTHGETDLPVPRLVDARDPYTCKKIPIAIFGNIKMRKPMYWCKSRRFKKYQSDEVAVAEGFFIASSRQQYDRAFIFRPSPTDDQIVIPHAVIVTVSLLSDVYHRVGSSTVTPVSE